MSEDNASWNLLGFVLASDNRMKVMFALEGSFATPTQISESTSLRIGHVSNILIDLRKMQLVVCRNPEAKRGRIYSLTDKGNMALRMLRKAKP